jgi:ABC-type nitrate/sulfonate/bicarbonate transport system permease component
VSSLGYLFIDGEQRDFPTEIYVGLFMVIILAVVCDLILVGIRRALTPWASGRNKPVGERPRWVLTQRAPARIT